MTTAHVLDRRFLEWCRTASLRALRDRYKRIATQNLKDDEEGPDWRLAAITRAIGRHLDQVESFRDPYGPAKKV